MPPLERRRSLSVIDSSGQWFYAEEHVSLHGPLDQRSQHVPFTEPGETQTARETRFACPHTPRCQTRPRCQQRRSSSVSTERRRTIPSAAATYSSAGPENGSDMHDESLVPTPDTQARDFAPQVMRSPSSRAQLGPSNRGTRAITNSSSDNEQRCDNSRSARRSSARSDPPMDRVEELSESGSPEQRSPAATVIGKPSHLRVWRVV